MNTEGTGFYICKEGHTTESLSKHITIIHKEREQSADRRNVGESSCNSGDGTGQMAQTLMFMMMMIYILISHSLHACYIPCSLYTLVCYSLSVSATQLILWSAWLFNFLQPPLTSCPLTSRILPTERCWRHSSVCISEHERPGFTPATVAIW